MFARRLKRLECPNITAFSGDGPIFWSRARGANVQDADGNIFIDLTGGFGVAAGGHSDPAVRSAINRQSASLWHALGDVQPAQIKVLLMESLRRVCPRPLDRIFLTSSGADAVEIAMKTAFLATGKPGVLVFEGGYHGLTYGALQATSLLCFDRPFRRQLKSLSTRVPFPPPDPAPRAWKHILKRIEHQITAKPIGAVLIEPIQGRGGIRAAPRGFLADLRDLCTRRGVILICDEIFSGMGRTGRWFAFEHSGIVPDLVTAGKGLTGGFPLAACIGRKDIMSAWPRHRFEPLHTGTFFGNPLGCAMALAVLRRIQKNSLLSKARNTGRFFMNALERLKQRHAIIQDVRGAGLMLGMELSSSDLAARFVTECLKQGIIVLAEGVHQNVISMTPPLMITPRQVLACADGMDRCLHSLAG